MTPHGWRDLFQQRAMVFVGTAAFPRLAYRLRWSTRLGPRGLFAYVAFNTLVLFAVRTWVIPYFKRMDEKSERARQELREQLGREPTDEEALAHLLRGYEDGGRGAGTCSGRRRRPDR